MYTFNRLLSIFTLCFFVYSSALALPVQADQTDKPVEWPALTAQQFNVDIKFHRLRVQKLSAMIAQQLSADKSLVKDIAKNHDINKHMHIHKLFRFYRTELKNPNDVHEIQLINQLDERSEQQPIIDRGLHLESEKSQLALLAVNLADKLDRYLFPRALAKQTLNIDSENIISPELAKVVKPLPEYLNLREYLNNFHYTNVTKVKNIMNYIEAIYFKKMSTENLLPTHIYKFHCTTFFR